MDPEACRTQIESHCDRPTTCNISIICELFSAVGASTITTLYTIHHEERLLQDSRSELQVQAFEIEHQDPVLNPPPSVMFGACLILGCALSSYAYRQQEYDDYQSLIFVCTITAACGVGYFQDIKPNLIMLALIPWALCIAMLVSTSLHWILRTMDRRATYQEFIVEAIAKH